MNGSNMFRLAGTIHKHRFPPSPTQTERATASRGWIHLLQVSSRQSQSFSWSYGSILLTSLTYIVLSASGCSPRRPAAIMSTNGRENESFLWLFKSLQKHTGHHKMCGALLTINNHLLAIRFRCDTSLTRKENSSQSSCRRLQVQLPCHKIWTKKAQNI